MAEAKEKFGVGSKEKENRIRSREEILHYPVAAVLGCAGWPDADGLTDI